MKYRHKPTVVDAIQLTHQNVTEVQRWCQARTTNQQPTKVVVGLEFHTLEGVTVAGYGDWVIRGQAGELYPCKANIFEANYEPIPEQPSAREQLEAAMKLQQGNDWRNYLGSGGAGTAGGVTWNK